MISSDKGKGWLLALLIFYIVMKIALCEENTCNQIPSGINTLPPDDRYLIEILGIGEKYLPGKRYPVQLRSKDGKSTFIAFTISVKGDTKRNEKNERRPIDLKPGDIEIADIDENVASTMNCNNTAIQADLLPKTKVQVIWKAPPKGNKCVTIYALVAIKPDVWYQDKGPLTKVICEDDRKADDMSPLLNDNCKACNDARYRLTFEGLWMYNTHSNMYPKEPNVAQFSDIVGASHNRNYNIFNSNDVASEGLKALAEQGNTTALELDMQSRLINDVRTIIKATKPLHTNLSTTATFRVSPKHHMVSLVTAILPSPDWFLGASNIELCEHGTHKWAPKVTLNLYPMDAGTDKGINFDSANDNISPPQAISPAVINNVKGKDRKAFARIHFSLIRTYSLYKYCPDNVTEEEETEEEPGEESEEVEEEEEDQNGGDTYENPGSETTPESTSEAIEVQTDPDSSPKCPLTQWEEWLPCENDCIDGKITGYHTRLRHFIVNGIPTDYMNSGKNSEENEVSEFCEETYSLSESEECEEDCEVPTTAEPESEIPMRRIAPGYGWRQKFSP